MSNYVLLSKEPKFFRYHSHVIVDYWISFAHNGERANSTKDALGQQMSSVYPGPRALAVSIPSAHYIIIHAALDDCFRQFGLKSVPTRTIYFPKEIAFPVPPTLRECLKLQSVDYRTLHRDVSYDHHRELILPYFLALVPEAILPAISTPAAEKVRAYWALADYHCIDAPIVTASEGFLIRRDVMNVLNTILAPGHFVVFNSPEEVGVNPPLTSPLYESHDCGTADG